MQIITRNAYKTSKYNVLKFKYYNSKKEKFIDLV